MSKELQIRNSTVDFLVFTRDAGEDGIEVRVQNGDVWLTQKAISQLFDVDRSVITKHLSNIFKEGELDENSVCAKFAQTADDGKTWQEERKILLDEYGGFGYSCITSVDEETIGILYESSQAQMVFQQVKIKELIGD